MKFELYNQLLREQLPKASDEELERIAAGSEIDAAEVAKKILEQRQADRPKQRKRYIGFMDNDFIEEN